MRGSLHVRSQALWLAMLRQTEASQFMLLPPTHVLGMRGLGIKILIQIQAQSRAQISMLTARLRMLLILFAAYPAQKKTTQQMVCKSAQMEIPCLSRLVATPMMAAYQTSLISWLNHPCQGRSLRLISIKLQSLKRLLVLPMRAKTEACVRLFMICRH